MDKMDFEVIIIGGSYAGLSAAMALGRSLRKVLIIDGGEPCNAQTSHSHNFLTQDGVAPADIAAIGKSQVMKYETIEWLSAFALKVEREGESFKVETSSGDYSAKKVILATGIKDEMPAIPGFKESWGISVVHCPYCHGYEIRGKKTALMADREKVLHMAPMIRNLTNDLTVFTQGEYTFEVDQLEKLQKLGVFINSDPVQSIIHREGAMESIQLENGTSLNFEAMYAPLPFHQSFNLPDELGVEIEESGFIKVNPMQKTTAEGIFACGDNSSGMRSVANAVSTGNIAGAVVNMELVNGG